MHHYCTLKNALSDRLHEQAQSRETRFIEIQSEARLRNQQVAAIRADYAFSRYDFRTFYQGTTCIQAAMLVENPADVNDRYIVTCCTQTGEEVWTVQTPPFKKDAGPLFIAAVKARVEANRTEAR